MSKRNGRAPCSDPKGVFPFNCSVDLTQWRKQSEQAQSCSRKWRNTEDPPQELHSSEALQRERIRTGRKPLDLSACFEAVVLLPCMMSVIHRLAGRLFQRAGSAVGDTSSGEGRRNQSQEELEVCCWCELSLQNRTGASVLNFATCYWIFYPEWSEVSPAQLTAYLLIPFMSVSSTFMYLGELRSCSLYGQILIFLLFLSALLWASMHFPLAVHWQYCLLSWFFFKYLFNKCFYYKRHPDGETHLDIQLLPSIFGSVFFKS